MGAGNVISKELISHLVMLKADHQSKVLSYIKSLLDKESVLEEDLEMGKRAETSEQDIETGKVKKAGTFKREFEQWQKKKRAAMKL